MIGTSNFWSPALATPTSSAPDVQERVSDFPNWSLATWLHWILRMAMLWCFIGHGSFGIIGKAGWLPYYHVFGFGDRFAWDTMPIIGAVDIAIGIITFFRPMRAVLLYGIVWTFLTALLRPMAGQGLWQEVAERGGNFGIPIALLILVGVGSRDVRSWFEYARPQPVTFDLAKVLSWSLRISIALLLIGHGGFGITNLHHKEWVSYLGVLGFGKTTVESMNLIPMVAWFEVGLGLAVLIKPARGLIIFVFAWKLGFELLRPISGEPIGEFIERGGDYFLPIALLMVQAAVTRRGDTDSAGYSRPIPVQARSYLTSTPAAPVMSWTAAASAPVWTAAVPAAPTTPAPAPARVAPRTPPAPPVADADEEVVRAAAALAARIGAHRAASSR